MAHHHQQVESGPVLRVSSLTFPSHTLYLISCLRNRAIKANPKAATDLGCGTGLSMYMLDSKWPSIEKVTGIDLSTFKLAVCQEKKSMMVHTKDHSILSLNFSTIKPNPFLATQYIISITSPSADC